MGHKETIFGVKYYIKLRGVAKEIWIQSTDLSKGVAELYKNKQDLSSNTKPRVDRGHVIVQKKFLKTQKDILEKQKDHPSVEAASAAVTKTVSTSPRQTDSIRVGKNVWLVFDSPSVHRCNQQDFVIPNETTTPCQDTNS